MLVRAALPRQAKSEGGSMPSDLDNSDDPSRQEIRSEGRSTHCFDEFLFFLQQLVDQRTHFFVFLSRHCREPRLHLRFKVHRQVQFGPSAIKLGTLSL